MAHFPVNGALVLAFVLLIQAQVLVVVSAFWTLAWWGYHRAALEMRARIRRINAERRARGEIALDFGVAVHTGEVVLGAVGIAQRSDFTAIGDTVNTAARLEGQCRELGLDIALSGQTAAHLPRSEFEVVDLAVVSIRGRQQPVPLATLAD